MSHQQDLPLAEAEAIAAERAGSVRLVIAAVEGDLHLREFLERVAGADARGVPLVLSHAELAARPHGLCCSREKAKATTVLARTLGLVDCDDGVNTIGARSANRYRMNWEGVGRILRLGPRMARAHATAADGVDEMNRPSRFQTLGPPGLLHPPQGATHPGPGLIHPAIERLDNKCLSGCSFSDTVTGTGTGTGTGNEFREAFSRSALLKSIPELAEAAGRRIAALPPGKLAYGAFAPLHGGHLTEPRTMVRWFRCQLSLPQPLTGPSEAELLLVLAAAAYALAVPKAQIQKSVAAIFASTVGRGLWRKVLPQVQRARRQLDEAIALLAERGESIAAVDTVTESVTLRGDVV